MVGSIGVSEDCPHPARSKRMKQEKRSFFIVVRGKKVKG
jgi:hypothetical protein